MLDFMELCFRKRGCDIFFYFMSKSIVWSWNEIWLKWKPNQPMNFTAIIYPLSTQYYPMCDAFQKWHSDDIFFSNFWSKIGFQLFKILFSNSWLKIGTFWRFLEGYKILLGQNISECIRSMNKAYGHHSNRLCPNRNVHQNPLNLSKMHKKSISNQRF